MKNILKSTVLIPFLSFAGIQSGISQEVELANSMLWSVVDTTAPEDISYLFGTIHQISQRDFTMKDKLVNALNNSDVLLTEMDLSDPLLAETYQKLMVMEDGMTLEKLLSKKEYATLNGYLLEGTGESLDNYNNIKPFITSSKIMTYYIDGAPASYDMMLTQMAVMDTMDIIALETLDQQMGVMDKMSYKEQAKFLMEIVNDPEKTKERYYNVVAAYKDERLADLGVLLDESLRSEDEKTYLIIDRNKRWVPVIESAMKNGKAMVAVGAGHLGGDLGLINLLREKGYVVEPVFEEEEE